MAGDGPGLGSLLDRLGKQAPGGAVPDLVQGALKLKIYAVALAVGAVIVIIGLVVIGAGGAASALDEGGGSDLACGVTITNEADRARVEDGGFIAMYEAAGAQLGPRGPSILAAIHKVESNFGDGREQPIYGPPTPYGRAVGPMQFLESTWATDGVDGNGDGRADPQDPADAIPSAANLLGPGAPADWRAAIWAYNHSDLYVDEVLATATDYADTCDDGGAVQGLDFEDTSGAWGGSEKLALAAADIGARYGCEHSGKRTPEQNEAVGGAEDSDHLTTNVNAYAIDLSPPEPLPENEPDACSLAFPDGKADRVAADIAAWLGMPRHTGLVAVTRGKYRFQLIWQYEGHYDHVHLGVRLVG